MERKEIEGKFWAAIDKALKAAGAVLDGQAKGYLAEAVEIGAQEISYSKGERLDGSIAYGIRAYEDLVREAAGLARRYESFPTIDMFALTEAMRAVGNRPPFWM